MLRTPARLLAATFVLAGAACEKSGGSPDGGVTTDGAPIVCTVEAPTACPDPPTRYADVQPIFQRVCVPCHNGLPGGHWPLMQYSHVADWQDLIREQMLTCAMPPPESGVPMSNEDRVAILTWIRCGFPE